MSITLKLSLLFVNNSLKVLKIPKMGKFLWKYYLLSELRNNIFNRDFGIVPFLYWYIGDTVYYIRQFLCLYCKNSSRRLKSGTSN